MISALVQPLSLPLRKPSCFLPDSGGEAAGHLCYLLIWLMDANS